MSRYLRQSLKAFCLLALTPALSGCSFLVLAYLRNTTSQPVSVRLYSGRPSRAPWYGQHGLRYAPRLLKPKLSTYKQLRDSLPVTTRPDGISFVAPPHSTISLGLSSSVGSSLLLLLRADSTSQLLDSVKLAHDTQYKLLGGGRVWYDIQ